MDIKKLSPAERLRLIESLWNSLSEDQEAVPLTTEQREELDRRLDQFEREGQGGIPWEDVFRKLRESSD